MIGAFNSYVPWAMPLCRARQRESRGFAWAKYAICTVPGFALTTAAASARVINRSAAHQSNNAIG